jgi:hypothetical protein
LLWGRQTFTAFPRKRLCTLSQAATETPPHPQLPRIVRQVRQDLVVSAAGCRIDEHLEQRPAEASSGPVTRNRPEVGQRHADLDITLSDGEGRGRTLTEPPICVVFGRSQWAADQRA